MSIIITETARKDASDSIAMAPETQDLLDLFEVSKKPSIDYSFSPNHGGLPHELQRDNSDILLSGGNLSSQSAQITAELAYTFDELAVRRESPVCPPHASAALQDRRKRCSMPRAYSVDAFISPWGSYGHARLRTHC